MVFRLPQRLVAAALALSVSGCASLSNVQTADTLGKGKIQVGIEPGLWGGAGSGGAAFLPHVDASLRLGVADRVDLGVRAGSSFLEFQSKFLLTTPGDPRLAISIAPTIGGVVGFGGTTSNGGAAGLLNIGVPVLIGLKVGSNSEFIIGPRVQNIVFFGSSAGSPASSYLMGLGGSLGFFFGITDTFGLLPEVAAVYPVVGGSNVTGVGGAAFQGLNAGGALFQFKLGIIIGSTRRAPTAPDLQQAPPPPPPPPPPTAM
jgi:hypothetical protein